MNNLRYKDKTPSKYYYGATEIPSIYYGGTQVYSQGPYIQLEYIDFTPTTYINTDTKPNASSWGQVDIDLTFALNSSQDNNILFTTQTAGYYNTYKSVVNASNVLSTIYGYNRWTKAVGTLELNRKYHYQMTRSANRIKPILDEVSIWETSNDSDGNSTPLLIGQGNFRCYSCKITIGGQLLRDYIPVIKTSDSKPYMLDTLNNQYYPIIQTQLDPSTDSGGSGR